VKNWDQKFYPQGIKDQDTQLVAGVRDAFAALAVALEQNLPEGRYKSMVLTHLEVAAAMATKSFTHNNE